MPHRCIAHRCGALLGPENTLAAGAESLRAGLRAFECDVKLSADGVPFLLHDDTLERTTDGRGRASAQPWSRLARLDASRGFGTRFAGTRLTALHELAQLLHGDDVWLNLEIKTDAGADVPTQAAWGRQIAQAAARLWAGTAQPPVLSSFSLPALQAAAQAAPQLPRAWLSRALPPRWREPAQALGLQALHLEAHLFEPQTLREVHAAGLQLRLFTVNAAAQLAAWLHLGVDGVFTDVPESTTLLASLPCPKPRASAS